MRDIVLRFKDGDKEQCVLRVDLLNEWETTTISWCAGVKGTRFEDLIPFRCGTTMTMTDFEQWFAENKSVIEGWIYGGFQMEILGAEKHTVEVTPVITLAEKATVILTGTPTGGEGPIHSDTLELTNNVPVKLTVYAQYNYVWSLPEGESWVEEPSEFEVSDDSTKITLKIKVGEAPVLNPPVPTPTSVSLVAAGTAVAVTFDKDISTFAPKETAEWLTATKGADDKNWNVSGTDNSAGSARSAVLVATASDGTSVEVPVNQAGQSA